MNHKYSTIALIALLSIVLIGLGAAELITMNDWTYNRFDDEKLAINPYYFNVDDEEAYIQYRNNNLYISVPTGNGYINENLICLETGNCDGLDGGVMTFDIRSSSRSTVTYNITDSEESIVTLYVEKGEKYFLTGEAR